HLTGNKMKLEIETDLLSTFPRCFSRAFSNFSRLLTSRVDGPKVEIWNIEQFVCLAYAYVCSSLIDRHQIKSKDPYFSIRLMVPVSSPRARKVGVLRVVCERPRSRASEGQNGPWW